MQKISNIYFKGAIQKPQNSEKKSPISNPITADLGEKALPICDRSLAINPSLPSDFLNEADLARYSKVQKEWAGQIAQKYNIPVENIIARLPEIKFGDEKAMLRSFVIGQFEPVTNTIEINPIREITNLCGGDEAKIVHESVHGYFHNLRKNYANQITRENLYEELDNIVMGKMFNGEHGLIINSFKTKKINGNVVAIPDLMDAPELSEKERAALLDTMNSIMSPKYVSSKTAKLNYAGKKFVRKNLLPQLTDYPQFLLEAPKNKNKKVYRNILDYVNSFFTRRNLLYSCVKPSNLTDVPRSIEPPLTQTEQNIARNTLNELLQLQEGNRLREMDQFGALDNSSKSYFASYEEILARAYESHYRQDKVNQKIKDIEAKGLQPSDVLLKERQTAGNNLKLADLTRGLDKVEKQINGAVKDPEKVLEIERIKKEIQFILEHHDSAVDKISKYVDEKDYYIIPEEDIIATIENRLPSKLKKHSAKFSDITQKLNGLGTRLNELDSPEKLLADTPQNAELKAQFGKLMMAIKDIAAKSDLLGIPKQFFNTKEEFVEANANINKIMQKWAKRLL